MRANTDKFSALLQTSQLRVLSGLAQMPLLLLHELDSHWVWMGRPSLLLDLHPLVNVLRVQLLLQDQSHSNDCQDCNEATARFHTPKFHQCYI